MNRTADSYAIETIRSTAAHLGAKYLGNGRYAFEHRIWISEEHGDESSYYLVSGEGLLDLRARCDPRGLPFDTWLSDHCVIVSASWWNPDDRYRWCIDGAMDRWRSLEEAEADGVDVDFTGSIFRITVDHTTGFEIAG